MAVPPLLFLFPLAGMDCGSMSLSEESFKCSICLDVFTEPVTTPCGHNYCKECITDYWSLTKVPQCPLCMDTFHGSPQLRVNNEFKDILVLLKRMKASGDDSSTPAQPCEVPCDLCSGTGSKAVKSCLVCLASYCSTHLEPHHAAQALKWHKLINPVKSLEDRACRQHNKLKEFFCREDQSCICSVCMNDGHTTHNTVALEEVVKERKKKLKCIKMKVNQHLSEKSAWVQKIQNQVKRSRLEVEKTKSETVKSVSALVASIESRKESLLEGLEEKQRAAEEQADALVGPLQQEIDKNHETIAELEELLTSEDDFRLLRDLPSFSSTSNSKPYTATTHIFMHTQMVRSTLARMKEALDEQMENVIGEFSLSDKEETLEEQTENVFYDELGKIQQQYATKVTLDPNTAHPALIVSEDRKQVRDGGLRRKVPNTSTRFDCLHYVLGSEGFSSGRVYYEVTVKGQPAWEIGVTRESISKRGVDLSLSPENGCWTLGLYSVRCQANADPPVILNLSKQPQKVGVFVDYEGGLVSFYNVDTRSLMYSFTKCVFTTSTNTSTPPQSTQARCRVYTGSRARTRIYPIFRPSFTPLKITP